MYIDRALRLMAGFFTLLSLALAHYHDPRWLWFTAFVGLNLFQSGFTNWCPAMAILAKLGVPKQPKASCGK
ncbi:sulfurtransferase [Geomonas sp. Red276]